MKALVVGLGSIAHRHIKNLKTIAPDTKVAVWRQHSKSADLQDLESLVGHVVFDLVEALAWQPEFALITNPASLHIDTGLALARENCHLFIEKPLSNTLDGVDDLLNLCHERALVLMVGYNFRFYRPLQIMQQALVKGRIGRVMAIRAEVGQFLPEWRPGKDYRQSVSARRELGGGVLLELSHELDYVRWLGGEVSAISARIGHLSDLEIDVEDTAEITMQFENSAIGSVHLNMIQRPATRICRVVGTGGTLIWDGLCHHVRLFSVASNAWSDLQPANTIDRNEMYIAELRHFLDCIEENSTPIVSGEDGRRVLKMIAAATLSSLKQQVVEL